MTEGFMSLIEQTLHSFDIVGCKYQQTLYTCEWEFNPMLVCNFVLESPFLSLADLIFHI